MHGQYDSSPLGWMNYCLFLTLGSSLSDEKRNSGLKCNLHAAMIVSCVLLESGFCFKYALNKRLFFYGFDVAIAMCV